MFKRLLISFLAAIIVFLSIAPSATHAQWYDQGFWDFYSQVYDDSNPSEIFGERYTAAQVQWIMYSFGSIALNALLDSQTNLIICLASKNLGDCAELLVLKDNTTDLASLSPAINEEKNLFSTVFKPRPFSGIAYIRNSLSTFHIVPEANAQVQGFGYEGLSVVQELWKSMRNASYGLFVIASVVLSFMIMFRVKTSPQTVVTVQSVLPKLVLALILVTFSYAIAGFLVDLMYVVIGLISLVLDPIIDNDATWIYNLMVDGPNIAGIRTGIFGFVAAYIVLVIIISLVALVYTIGIIPLTLAAWLGIATVGVSAGVSGFLAVLFLLVIAGIVLWTIFRIITMLIKAFAQILLLTIFAPLHIVGGLVVTSLGFGQWVKSFVANLAVFPVAGVLFILSFYFLFHGWTAMWFEAGFDGGDGYKSIGALLGDFAIGSVTTDAIAQEGSWPPLLLGGAKGALPLIYVGISVFISMLIPKAGELAKTIIEGAPFRGQVGIGDAIGWGAILGEYKAGKSKERKLATGGAGTPTPTEDMLINTFRKVRR